MSGIPLSRRQLLGGGAALSLSCWSLSACSVGHRAPDEAEAIALLGLDAAELAALADLGQRVVVENPDAAEAARRLLARERVESVRGALLEAAAHDAATERVVAVDGWLIPLHLAGIASLIHQAT